MRLAIHPDLFRFPGGGEASLSRRWIDLAEGAGVQVRLLDALAEDALEAIRPCDGFVWHFAANRRNAPAARQLLLTLDQGMALPSWPDWRDAWHFGDTAAQAALLEAAGLPMPRTWIFWTEGDAADFLRDAPYPLRVRSAGGEGDFVVQDARAALDAARRTFAPEAAASGSLLTKMFWGVRAADPRDDAAQRRCFVLQEVLPDTAPTTRLLVVADRAFAAGDERPSIDPSLIALAFDAATQLRSQSLSIDLTQHEGVPLITGLRYAPTAFASRPVGHWRRTDLAWDADLLRSEDAIFETFLARVRTRGVAATRV